MPLRIPLKDEAFSSHEHALAEIFEVDVCLEGRARAVQGACSVSRGSTARPAVEKAFLEQLRRALEVVSGDRLCRKLSIQSDEGCSLQGVRIVSSRASGLVVSKEGSDAVCQVPGRPLAAAYDSSSLSVFSLRLGGVTVSTWNGRVVGECEYLQERRVDAVALVDMALVSDGDWMYAVDLFGGVYHWQADGEGPLIALFRVPKNGEYKPGDALVMDAELKEPLQVMAVGSGGVLVWNSTIGYFAHGRNQYREGIFFDVR